MRPRQDTGPAAPCSRQVIWQYGFRPFYLLASIFACASLLLWVAQLSGLLPAAYLAGPLWHGHEMLFGFTTAVIAGFLLTAVATWTQQPPLRGGPLACLAILWLAGRVLVLTPWSSAAAIANLLFPLAVGATIAVPLMRSRNRRNMLFIGLLALLGALAALLHLSAAGVLDLPTGLGLRAGLDVVLLVMLILAGRVVPMFTHNAIAGAGANRHPLVERAAPLAVAALLVADLLEADGVVVAALAGIAAVVHAARLVLWRPWRTLHAPLVWILHAAYGWIVIHLLLRVMAAAGWVAPSLAIHALTVGAIGGMTIGMMTRTARGHTGRPLQAGTAETAMFLLTQAAAVVRVGGAILLPGGSLVIVQASGLLWSAAFGLYAIAYWPVLTGPRVDGRPG